MSRTLEARAPAKVNLGLRIRARREDGYHELESVFVPLDLADRLALRVTASAAPRVSLVVSGQDSGVPLGEPNLAVRAARAFLAEATLSQSVDISLEKRIPVGAGLGGGSSDAGTVLRLLSGNFPDALPAAELSRLARSLGADVPFFLDPRPARVSGVGERINPLPGFPALALLLLNPGVALSTTEVYRAFDALVPDPGARSAAASPGRSGEVAGLCLDNDLEPAALRLCPELRRLRGQLEELGASAVGMSGSGPTLFGVFPSAAAAERARTQARLQPDVFARVAATLESG
jgi:4-diphosphocytidyl-2-C-methyl-D-erythritol kinase